MVGIFNLICLRRWKKSVLFHGGADICDVHIGTGDMSFHSNPSKLLGRINFTSNEYVESHLQNPLGFT